MYSQRDRCSLSPAPTRPLLHKAQGWVGKAKKGGTWRWMGSEGSGVRREKLLGIKKQTSEKTREME